MTRYSYVLGIALLVAACAVGPPAPTASLAPVTASAPATAGAPASGGAQSSGPTSTPRPTPTPVAGVGVGNCPSDSPLTVSQFMDAEPACFGSGAFEVRGWLDGPPDTGFEPPLVEPTWLFVPGPNVLSLWEVPPVEPGHFCARSVASCPWFFLYANPASGLTLDFPPRWVTVTGHLDDPAAATCHFVYPEGWTEPPIDDAIAVAGCRTKFVVESFRDAP